MRCRGFTLLELLVVTAIVAVVAGLLVPRLVFRRSDVAQARRELQGMVRYLRAEASGSGHRYRLRVDRESGLCVPEVQIEGRYEAVEATLADPRRLSVDRILDLVTAAGKSAGVQVYPGGFVEPALLEVQVDEAIYTLSVHALTGKVEARPGKATGR